MKKVLLLLSISGMAARATAQNVGIGTTTPVATLDVNSPAAQTSKFNGPNQMFIGIYETNVLRGYLGSFSGAAEDFDIGTSSANTNGKLHFAIKAVPKMTIDAGGNVGIGTSTPAASALLDLNSTSQGLLVPRMTTAQRNAIASPATGLMVYDMTTGGFWYYNGSTWTALSGGGGLTLPYSQSVNLNTPAFQLFNFGSGAAIDGASSNEFGIGISARSSGNFGWALNAYTDKAGAVSLRSIADNGVVFHGENTSATNANRLMYLLNKGVNKTLQAQLSNTASTSVNVQVLGNHLGSQLEVLQTNAANTAPAVSIENSGTGEGLSATASTGYGLKGVTNASSSAIAAVYGDNTGTQGSGVKGIANFPGGFGVQGSSTTGTGVYGYSNDFRAVSGITISGSALYGNSTAGYALETVGNVKISGGNTNPTDHAVLTSDAGGNATWRQLPKVAFRTYGISSTATAGTPNNEIPHDVYKKVEFQTESYDIGGGLNVTGSNPSSAATSTYTASRSGVYSFSAALKFESVVIANNYINIKIRLVMKRGLNISVIAENIYDDVLTQTNPVMINTDQFLIAGDQVWIEVKHENGLPLSVNLETPGSNNYFSGHLLFEY